MSQILATDSLETTIKKLSQGNPGCVRILLSIMETENDGALILLNLDSLELYGSKIYMIFNDCCNSDMKEFLHVIRNVDKDTIHKHVSGSWGTPFKKE